MFKSTVMSAAIGAMLITLSCAANAQGKVHNRNSVEASDAYAGFIIKYKQGSQESVDRTAVINSVAAVVTKLKGAKSLDMSPAANPARPFAVDHVRQLAAGGHLIQPSRRLNRGEAQALLDQIAADPNVEYVEPNLILKHAGIPNDSLYSQQWGTGANGIRAEKAWDKSNGSGVTVAVIDTGITSHPDLSANVIAGYDFISDAARAKDGTARDADASDAGDSVVAGQCYTGSPAQNSSWHGTHVAGTIAAVANNSSGVAGVASAAKIMPVRVLGACGGTIADISDAITWASGGAVAGVTSLPAASAARVINMSLSGKSTTCPASMQTAISGAVSRGTTVVVAAGNDAQDATLNQPANCADVIAVAAVDSTGAKASFSNFGPKVDIAAPGVNIVSTLNTGTSTPIAPTYAYYNGTSMAAPHVAGVVALVQSRRLAAGRPLLAPADVKQLLKVMARPLPVACTSGCGAGMIDASESVDVSLSNGVPVLAQTDISGKIRSVMFERKAAAAAASFTDFAVEVPAEFQLVGGGVEGAEGPAGHLITASYPDVANNAWKVSTKDHLQSNPAAIKAWAVGIRIASMTTAELRATMQFDQTTSAVSATPSASTPNEPWTHMLIGGGVKVGPNASGNLVTASYSKVDPATNRSFWYVASKEHGTSSPAAITAYSVLIPRTIWNHPAYPNGLNLSSGSIGIGSGANTPVAHPVSTAVQSFTDGYVVVGCGAYTTTTGAGQLLWKMQPFKDPVDGKNKCTSASKDHVYSSPGSIMSYVFNLRAY